MFSNHSKFNKPEILKNPDEPSEKEKKINFFFKHLGQIMPVLAGDQRSIQILSFQNEFRATWEKLIQSKTVSEKDLTEIKNSLINRATREELDYLLERFETKVFLLEKPEEACDPDAKRILLYASEPISLQSTNLLINELQKDKRCRAIGLVTDNVAGKDFEQKFEDKLDNIKVTTFNAGEKTDGKEEDKEDVPVFADILDMVEKVKEHTKQPFDIVLTCTEGKDSPSASALWNSKSNIGADKLFIVQNGWAGLNARKDLLKGRDTMEEIDGIFCNDKLSKSIIHKAMPDFPEDKIFTTGTPVIDLAKEGVEKNRESGRRILKLNDKEIAILYVGDTSRDYADYGTVDRRINEITFSKTVEATKQLAKQQPEKKFALLIRPHPRDPNKKELLSSALGKEALKNFRLIPATNEDDISMEEARGAADAVASIVSTENNLAAMLGKPGIYLGYETSKTEPRLGNKVLNNIYTKETLKAMEDDEKTPIISSPEELVDYLKNYHFFDETKNKKDKMALNGSATNRILNIIFNSLEDKK